MFDDVISTGLQAVLTEIFEAVDKKQLNVSLVGDIFQESHLELTDLRLKKTLLKDLNLPVEIKEGLVGKLVIQGLSGVMTGDPVTITIAEVLVLLAPSEGLSDPEAALAARRLVAALREMFANRYAEDFLEDALGIKLEDKMSLQAQNKLNRKLLRHIVRKLLAGISINLQTVHVRFELPAGGVPPGTPAKPSTGVGGGGACDAVGVMLPSVSLRTCGTDHPSFAKFVGSTPLDRVVTKTPGARGSANASPRRGGAEEDDGEDKKNLCVVRKRATLANLQVYGDYGVDSYVTAISAAVSAARNRATNPRQGSRGSVPGPGPSGVGPLANTTGAGAVAAAKAVRSLFQQKWKSERHALLFKPLAVEVGAEVHQWDKAGGRAVVPVYRVRRLNVGVGELQAVMDSEQGRVLGTALNEIINLVRRARFNRFVPQAFLPLRNLPPPKVRPPKPAKDGAPGGMLPSMETWSWSAEIEVANTGSYKGRPKSAQEAILRGGFQKEGGAWARAMWRFAGGCVRRDVRLALTRKLPATLPSWDGAISRSATTAAAANGSATTNGNAAYTVTPGRGVVVAGGDDSGDDSSSSSPLDWRVNYLRLHARTLSAREAKNTAQRIPDVRRMGVPRGREALSLAEMWEMARVESFAPGDEVVFLRMAAKVSSHFEWGRARRARAAAKSASHRRASPEAVAAAAGAAAAAAAWTVKDDRAVLARLDALRAKRAATALAEKEKGAAGGAGAAGAVEEEEEDDDEEEITSLHFASTGASGFSDDEDESGSDSEEDSDDDDSEDDDESEGLGGNTLSNGGGPKRFSLADIAAKAKELSAAPPPSHAAGASPARTGGAGGGRKMGGKASEAWGKLLGIPRLIFQVESVGIELRTRISGGARRPLVALSAGGLSGSMEGDEARHVLWWELRVGKVTFRDLCSSWGAAGSKSSSAAAAPVARTLLSGSASGVAGRDWAFAGDPSGAAARSFLVVRVVHDPNRFACGMFDGSAATLAELRAHVVLGCITGKIPPQVLGVFNAAARDILVKKGISPAPIRLASSRRSSSSSSVVHGDETAARQLRVALGSIHKALSGSKSVTFRPKKRKGPGAAVRALSLARGAVAGGGGGGGRLSPAEAGEVDSKELYRVVAGMLPGDFEVRVHTSEIVVQVDSRAEDLLEAGKVALEAIGESKAAANMRGGAAAADSIQLEVDVVPLKVDAYRTSRPNPELWVDTGIVRTKLRAPEKAVEAVVTALLTSAQRTTAAVALLSQAGEEG